ncbi:zinc ribbon domain-containing protein [bacterium]|nr:zinc ribbon domain-containing protein [bacterium]
MPIYEYECTKCGHAFELVQTFQDRPRRRCPVCRGKVNKLIGNVGISFKGAGYYVTDSKPEKKKKETSTETGTDA